MPLAFWPNFHHPDEIFQYLESAWRALGHDGIVTWEWRYGMRSWLLPTVMAGPVAIGDWLAPGGTGAFVLPRLLVALASLSIVASAWAFGERISRTHAVIAGLVAAIWFELAYFAPHTLGEPLSSYPLVDAALSLLELAFQPVGFNTASSLIRSRIPRSPSRPKAATTLGKRVSPGGLPPRLHPHDRGAPG